MIAEGVSFYGHANCFGECFEDGFNFMMLIIAPAFDVQVTAGRIAERFEEMVKHFGGHITDFFAAERGVEFKEPEWRWML